MGVMPIAKSIRLSSSIVSNSLAFFSINCIWISGYCKEKLGSIFGKIVDPNEMLIPKTIFPFLDVLEIKYAIASACIGGGQGIAMLLENGYYKG